MITVLRLGHRRGRDKRITTHVGLVARAFGADELLISTKDGGIEDTLMDVSARFGGEFRVKSGIKWRKVIQRWEGISVHLTMYGEHVDDVMLKMQKDKDLLIIVGAEKVPPEVYKAVDFNVAMGNQPHSEVAALAVFMDRLLGGGGLRKDFYGNVKIIPSKKGKKVVEVCD
ncbi:MAG: tRNA (cytidine(56)-2'-O)-methyltransferase [Thermoplasmata archaeon]|nr:MAG: tRNA (cytidine(56)-2'-O)-methyltransferase [Thermoplasmata archaeon]